MPRTIRFHLDENVDPRIAAGLRLHAIDVTTSAESGLLGTSDLEQLEYVIREGRVIITQDTDFLRLAAAGNEHPGIVFSSAGARSIGDVIRAARLIWELLEPVEMHHRIEYVRADRSVVRSGGRCECQGEDHVVRPASRSRHLSRSTPGFQFASHRSPNFSSRLPIVRIVNRRGSSPLLTSLHRSGVETGAPRTGRAEYGAASVCPRRFCR
jgi:predicted nuclease of predicted toxin-antitoxin system